MLIADRLMVTGQAQAGDAFATPTIVHFGAVLLLSAIVSAPWRGVTSAAVLWGLLGLTGIVYEIIVARRMRTQSVYMAQFEDWLFHVLLPFAAYATLAGSAYAARSRAQGAIFAIGAAVLLFKSAPIPAILPLCRPVPMAGATGLETRGLLPDRQGVLTS